MEVVMKPLPAPESSYRTLRASGPVNRHSAAYQLLRRRSERLSVEDRLEAAKTVVLASDPRYKTLELAFAEIAKMVDLERRMAEMKGETQRMTAWRNFRVSVGVPEYSEVGSDEDEGESESESKGED
jgi:hypothetical protein